MSLPQAPAVSAPRKRSWGWPQFFWYGLLTQLVAGIVLGATIGSADSDSFGNSDPNAAGIIIGILIGWVGTIWLLVGIGAWAVQVGTLNLRTDLREVQRAISAQDVD